MVGNMKRQSNYDKEKLKLKNWNFNFSKNKDEQKNKRQQHTTQKKSLRNIEAVNLERSPVKTTSLKTNIWTASVISYPA